MATQSMKNYKRNLKKKIQLAKKLCRKIVPASRKAGRRDSMEKCVPRYMTLTSKTLSTLIRQRRK